MLDYGKYKPFLYQIILKVSPDGDTSLRLPVKLIIFLFKDLFISFTFFIFFLYYNILLFYIYTQKSSHINNSKHMLHHIKL